MKKFRMKITKVACISLSLLVTMGSSIGIASEENKYSEEVQAENPEVKIDNILKNSENKSTQKAILKNNDTGDIYSVNLYEKNGSESKERTTKSEQLEGQGVKEFAVVVNDENIVKENQNTRLSGSQSTVEWDESLSVKGWIQVFYNYRNIDGRKHYLVTQVRGDWRVTDPTVSISGSRVRYACTNFGIGQNVAKDVSIPFDLKTGFTQYIDSTLTPTTIGAHSFVKIHRNSQTWNLLVPSMIVEN